MTDKPRTDSTFSNRTVAGDAPAAPSGAPQWLAESKPRTDDGTPASNNAPNLRTDDGKAERRLLFLASLVRAGKGMSTQERDEIANALERLAGLEK